MTEFPIRRAWSGTCADGELRDQFCNAVAHRINEESHDSTVAGYPPELVEDFLARCDELFASASPETPEATEALAKQVETAGLYDLAGD
jgi:hypothetical protein